MLRFFVNIYLLVNLNESWADVNSLSNKLLRSLLRLCRIGDVLSETRPSKNVSPVCLRPSSGRQRRPSGLRGLVRVEAGRRDQLGNRLRDEEQAGRLHSYHTVAQLDPPTDGGQYTNSWSCLHLRGQNHWSWTLENTRPVLNLWAPKIQTWSPKKFTAGRSQVWITKRTMAEFHLAASVS